MTETREAEWVKWRNKYFSAGISHEMWPKAGEDAFNAGWDAATYAANNRAGDAGNEAEKVERREVAVDKLAELYESDGWNGKTVDAIIKEAQG
jgi:hypothetical protein